MNKTMGYILIIIGIVAIIGGVMMLTRQTTTQAPSLAETQKNVSEKASVVTTNQNSGSDNNASKQASNIAATHSDSKEKGDAFEDFVVNLLADYRLKLLDRTQDAVSSAGVVAESCKNPDLHVKQRRGNNNIDYYLECKYRSNWTNNAVTFEDWQLDRYRRFQRDNHRKVIIALGVGGTADAPATFRLVPLDSIKGNSIRKIDTKFAVDPTPSALVEYMNTYFSSVFENSKSRNK